MKVVNDSKNVEHPIPEKTYRERMGVMESIMVKSLTMNSRENKQTDTMVKFLDENVTMKEEVLIMHESGKGVQTPETFKKTMNVKNAK